MYHTHFGLKEAPFSIKVNPSFLFMTQQHKDALATLLYGASAEGGFALLTGEVGTGKTTLIRALLQQLPSNVDIALVLNPTLNPIELLATICDELKIDYSREEQNLKSLTDKLHHYLLERHAQGRGVVVLIDEAQHLRFEALEQIRLLTNLETDTRKLMQIILVGQPELDTKLSEPELKQLAQRITARFHLGALSVNEAQAYVRHRLHIAGYPAAQTLFSEELVARIHRETEGVPRLINIICDRVLLGAYARNTTVLEESLLDTACKEVFGKKRTPEAQTTSKYTALNGLAIACLIAVSVFAYFRAANEPSEYDTEHASFDSKEQGNSEATQSQETDPSRATDAAFVMAEQTAFELAPPLEPQWWENGYSSEVDALNALLIHKSLITEPAENPCTIETLIEAQNVTCQAQNTETWPELIASNRVAVVQIVTPTKFHRYIPLIGIDQDMAQLLTASDTNQAQSHRLPLATMGSLWTGRSTLLWASPPGLVKPIGLGSQGTTVQWVARQFARLDQQSEPLTKTVFNRALSERVKLFQRRHALEDDGIVGMQTVLKLNDELDEHIELKLTQVLGGDSE